jgi:hypothetical protein
MKNNGKPPMMLHFSGKILNKVHQLAFRLQNINKSKGMHAVCELYYIALIYDFEVSLKEKKLLAVQEHQSSSSVLGGASSHVTNGSTTAQHHRKYDVVRPHILLRGQTRQWSKEKEQKVKRRP